MIHPVIAKLLDLDGRSVLVTGASGGIGAGIARRLQAAGARIAIHAHRHRDDAERIAARAALAAGGAGTVVLSSDRAVKALNGLHRKRNKPTNVLTFEFAPENPAVPGAGFLRGDIVLALGTVRREAAAAGRRPAHHLAHLVVHGALHLQGHDHHHVGDARRMEMKEARILSGRGVPNPWKRG